MPLYFDTFSNKFCVEPNSNTKLVCSDITENTRKNGKDAPPIICCDGKYKIQIDAYFDSSNKRKNYIRAKLYIDEKLLLPISRYFNPQKNNPCSNPIHNINYYHQHCCHPGPYTISQNPFYHDSPIDSNRLFITICEIYNGITIWIQREIQGLAKSYALYSQSHKNALEYPFRLAGSIELVRLYEDMINIHDYCGSAFDEDSIKALRYRLDTIQLNTNCVNISRGNAKLYDVIWNYVKDYVA